MEIRKSKIEDLEEILKIYESARKFMAESGNATQWGEGYPSLDLLKNDISLGNSFVCVDGCDILGTFYFEIGNEPTYKEIYDGKWLNDDEYGVIHRIAVGQRKCGVAKFCLNWCFSQINNIKIDTHSDNIPMQKFILKNGFEYCGWILKPDGSKRLAYQKALD